MCVLSRGYKIDSNVEDLCKKWEDTIQLLDTKEVRLEAVKQEYSEKEFKILYKDNINFKDVYGKNNNDVREHYVKNTLKDLYDERKELELEINKLKRQVSLLKALVYVKI